MKKFSILIALLALCQSVDFAQTSYNTYKHRALPDAPVCNVSYEALHAAINPKRTDYLYFVTV